MTTGLPDPLDDLNARLVEVKDEVALLRETLRLNRERLDSVRKGLDEQKAALEQHSDTLAAAREALRATRFGAEWERRERFGPGWMDNL